MDGSGNVLVMRLTSQFNEHVVKGIFSFHPQMISGKLDAIPRVEPAPKGLIPGQANELLSGHTTAHKILRAA